MDHWQQEAERNRRLAGEPSLEKRVAMIEAELAAIRQERTGGMRVKRSDIIPLGECIGTVDP